MISSEMSSNVTLHEIFQCTVILTNKYKHGETYHYNKVPATLKYKMQY